MKTILNLAILSILALSFTACSSKQVNNAKLTIAEKAGQFVETKLISEFQKNNVVVAGVDCTLEAKELGATVSKELAEVLKVKQELVTKSVNPVVTGICTYVSSTVLPQFIIDNQSNRACIRQLGASAVAKIGEGLCDKIDF